MTPTSANVLLVKTAIIIVVFCLAECAAGAKPPKSSCLKYGHSCWGGHGKRNGGVNTGGLIRIRDESPVGHMANTRWYLSRLVQAPADLRLWKEEREKHNLISRNSQERQNDSETDIDFAKRTTEDTEDIPSDSQPEDDNDEVVLLEEPPSSFGQKLRLYKLMKKNAEKIK